MAVVTTPADRSLILETVSWETYERLLAEHENASGTRFTYDGGRLQIMVLSRRHEEPNRTIAQIVEIVATELGLDLKNLGSVTFKRQDLAKGFEPDSCFYIQHAAAIGASRELDPYTDPPPDLIVEIDITSDSLNRFPIFAAMGVPEVWRFDGAAVAFFRLAGSRYIPSDRSDALPILTPGVVTRFVKESSEMSRAIWVRGLREWTQSQKP